jgi:drug/metabolite transporter (DMT)-like permease
LAAAFVPLVWTVPDMADLSAFAAAGLLNLCGRMLLVAAFQRAPASMLAPFSTIQIIFAAIIGLLVFQTLPDFWTWIGTGATLAVGLLVCWRESEISRTTYALWFTRKQCRVSLNSTIDCPTYRADQRYGGSSRKASLAII